MWFPLPATERTQRPSALRPRVYWRARPQLHRQVPRQHPPHSQRQGGRRGLPRLFLRTPRGLLPLNSQRVGAWRIFCRFLKRVSLASWRRCQLTGHLQREFAHLWELAHLGNLIAHCLLEAFRRAHPPLSELMRFSFLFFLPTWCYLKFASACRHSRVQRSCRKDAAPRRVSCEGLSGLW